MPDDGNGKYQIDIITSVKDNSTTSPEPFSLGQNYPNPFNPTTTIPFIINKAGNIKIEIFNIAGQRVRTLIHEYQTEGMHSVVWNALDDKGVVVGTGVFLYRLHADGKSDTKKMLLLDGGFGFSSTGGAPVSMPRLDERTRSAKISSTTWSVEIKGDEIKTYTASNLTLADGETYNFVVIRLPAITFVSIPGGTFYMGDEVGDLEDGCHPVHTATVSSFEMNVYEITNAQYAKYLNEALASGDVTSTSSSAKGAKGTYSGQEYIYLSGSYNSNNKCWITYSAGTFSVVSGYENWPVVYVTWYGSKSFAEWYGLDLPREAEWEYACRGGKQYKYGTDDGTISSTKVNYNSNVQYPKDVGSYPKNPFGLYDMSGNVWEWCNDWYGSYSSSSVTNPTGALSGSYRVARGGSWVYAGYTCRSARRWGDYPYTGRDHIGFRVVRR